MDYLRLRAHKTGLYVGLIVFFALGKWCFRFDCLSYIIIALIRRITILCQNLATDCLFAYVAKPALSDAIRKILME